MKERFLKRLALLVVVLLVVLPGSLTFAERLESPENGFSIDPQPPWRKITQSFQGGIVSYALEGSTALFHVTARDVEGKKTVADLKWEDLFSPQFESITIGTEGETVIGGEKAKYCVYRIKPGPFKIQMEGTIPAKYMNYVLVRDGKLFSITFVDTLENFSLDYSLFLAAARTIQFGEVKPLPPTGENSKGGSVSAAPPLDFKEPTQ